MRSASVAATKMNVFYIGGKNPISISTGGVPSDKLKVSCQVATMSGSGTQRITEAKRPRIATITLSGGGLESTQFKFRVKRIPNPIVKLGKRIDSAIPSREFRAQLGLLPDLPGFEFETKCKIQSYIMYYTPKHKDVIQYNGERGRFRADIAKVVKLARPGDQYSFTNIRVKSPRDIAARRVNGLTFKY